MTMDFSGRTILVAGGTGGLGPAVIDAFLAAGATVAMTWRDEAPPARERLLPFQADVTRTDQVTHIVTEILGRTGGIDALVNLVGGYAGGRVVDTDDTLWRDQFDRNCHGAFILSRAVLPHFLARRQGRIVHVGSKSAADPWPGAAAYLVSKAALHALVRVMALELTGTGVTVNAVLPGTIDTPANRRAMPDADRAGWIAPEELARTILFLASDDAAHLNGALIPV
jgi:NAD(P)-dependent dehydrogenase (short-subunit alcohol dehydrogenase family)